MVDDKERTRAIDLALAQIEKQFGKGSIMRLGNKEAIVPISVISSGSILARCGARRRRLTARTRDRDFGPESSGKTTLCVERRCTGTERGGKAAFIDAEHAMDPEYAARLGVDIDNC